MKQKILLLISLVLIAGQGWTTPVDSLITHLTELDSNHQRIRFELIDTLTLSDRFVRTDDIKEIDDDHKTRNPSFIFMILDLINQYQPFIYFDEIEEESESFVGVTVGTTATKKYRVYGDNVSGANVLNRLLDLLDASNVISGIKFDLLRQNLEDPLDIDVSDEIFVEPNLLRLSNFRDGKESIITITYRPTTENAQNFSCIGRYDLGFTNGLGNLVDFALLPVINMFGVDFASAVERTISTSESTVSFLDAPIGETTTKHFVVYGHNLTGQLKIEPSSEEVFSIYPKSISAELAEKGAEITVNYSPTSAGSHTAKVTISGGGAYPEKKVDIIGTTELPSFTIDKDSLTFTNVQVGTSAHKSFTVRGYNLTGPLYLTPPETTGDKGNFSIDKYEISAAEASEGTLVTVTYTPTEAGHLSGRITISGGTAGNKTISLDGYAEEPPRIIVDQYSLSFPGARVGVPVSQTIKVTGTNLTGDLSLIVDESDGNQFTIDSDKITVAQAANGRIVTVTYTPTEEGSHTGRILISGGGADSKSVSLSGSAQESPRITINPTSLSFPNKTVGKTYTQTFNVKGTNLTGDLTLTKDESDGGQFTFDKKTITAAEAKNGVNVTVTYAPTEEGSHSGRISVTGGGADKKTVSLSGSAKERIITTTASSLNFGKVAKGKSKTKKFIVKGTNLTGPLTLEATGTNKSLFTITPSSITAAQAANGVEVSVTYKPTTKGSHTAKITISGGDALSDKTVDLSGQCVEPNISVSPGTLDFGNMDAGTSKTLSFTVTGTDLTGDMSLIAASTDSHADFTITPTTLGANANAATVKVTCTANVAGSISGRVTVSGGDATSRTVGLTGMAKCYITTNTSSLNYTPSNLSLYFKVKCVGANNDLNLTLGGDNPSYFNLTKTSIKKDDAADWVKVTVGCTPKTKTRLSATITISGGGADNTRTVKLSYSNGVVSISAVEPEMESEEGNNSFADGGHQEESMNTTTNVNDIAINSKIYAEGQNIIIECPVEQSAVISDISGRVWNVNLQVGRNKIPVNASGVYIVRIREKTTKLMLK